MGPDDTIKHFCNFSEPDPENEG
jgi:hypothetical protein